MKLVYQLYDENLKINPSSITGSYLLPAFFKLPREEYVKIMQFNIKINRGGESLLIDRHMMKNKQINQVNNENKRRSADQENIIEIGERVIITQPGIFHMKCGVIAGRLDNNDKQNWFLIKVEGLEVGLPESDIERGVK
ncbi:MAG: hypothetical protein KAS16_00775 [Thermoplasmata archaeon]|nr:hypothetical protein [Thermoplasmata archaeon]